MKLITKTQWVGHDADDTEIEQPATDDDTIIRMAHIDTQIHDEGVRVVTVWYAYPAIKTPPIKTPPIKTPSNTAFARPLGEPS